MIILRQYAPNFGLPNPSPFCLKLETWLRMAELEFRIEVTPDPRKTPMGKLPLIEHDGKIVADSGCAIAYLEQTFNIRLNKSMSAAERARAHALERMLEEHTYWAMIDDRWLNDAVWPTLRQTFFGALPVPLRQLLPLLLRRDLRRSAMGQGLARHPREEIYRRFDQDMAALTACLADRPYFGGYQPANIDATVYGFLAQLVLGELATPLSERIRAYPQLVAYCERMRDRYYGSAR